MELIVLVGSTSIKNMVYKLVSEVGLPSITHKVSYLLIRDDQPFLSFTLIKLDNKIKDCFEFEQHVLKFQLSICFEPIIISNFKPSLCCSTLCGLSFPVTSLVFILNLVYEEIWNSYPTTLSLPKVKVPRPWSWIGWTLRNVLIWICVIG